MSPACQMLAEVHAQRYFVRRSSELLFHTHTELLFLPALFLSFELGVFLFVPSVEYACDTVPSAWLRCVEQPVGHEKPSTSLS